MVVTAEERCLGLKRREKDKKRVAATAIDKARSFKGFGRAALVAILVGSPAPSITPRSLHTERERERERVIVFW